MDDSFWKKLALLVGDFFFFGGGCRLNYQLLLACQHFTESKWVKKIGGSTFSK